MGKRFVIIFIVVAAAAAGVAWLTRGRGPAGLVLHEKPAGLQNTWPLDRSWAWSFPLPPTGAGDGVALRFRVKATPASSSPTSMPSLHVPTKPMSRAEADRSFGTSTFVLSPSADRPTSGTVGVQVLDLARVGASSDRDGQNLRVLAGLSIGGTSTRLSGDDIYLPGGRFAGHNIRGRGEEWVQGELYLMTFWLEADGRLFRYDVLLDTGPDGPAR